MDTNLVLKNEEIIYKNDYSEIEFIDVLERARNLLIQCNPKDKSEISMIQNRLKQLEKNNQAEIRDLVISLKDFGCHWGISDVWRDTAPTVLNVTNIKFKVPSRDSIEEVLLHILVDKVADFLYDIYNLREAPFNLVVKLEEQYVLKDGFLLRCLTEASNALGQNHKDFSFQETLASPKYSFEEAKKSRQEKALSKVNYSYCKECRHHETIRCDSAGEVDTCDACVVSLGSTTYLDILRALNEPRCPLGAQIKYAIIEGYLSKDLYYVKKEGEENYEEPSPGRVIMGGVIK